MKKKILILTKSRKHTAKCVVGVDIETKELIRLITDDENIHYSLSDEHLLYENNTPVKLLDIVEVDFVKYKPSLYHPEDWLINTNCKFKYIDHFNKEQYGACIDLHISHDDFIYSNISPFLTKDEFNATNKSIIIVVIKDIKFRTSKHLYNSKNKSKVSFRYNNNLYKNFSFTSDYFDFKDCSDAIAIITLPDGSDEFCKEYKQYYKYVAQIYAIQVNNNQDIFQYNNLLEDKLKQYRIKKSQELGLPAYCVFNNESIKQIAKYMPQNYNDLLSIYGFGKRKTNQFGNDVINIINDVLKNNPKFKQSNKLINSDYQFIHKIEYYKENDFIEINIMENDDENISRVLYLIKQHKNIFITGHAGTGKSYILSKLKEKIPKLVITSTTGIAAVNIKGQTLHSWAGVGICNRPIEQTVEKILKKSSIKNQIQKCKILAIDEISMLDIKTFEYVDAVLRQIRACDRPFGGIQVIFIGDFFQLPPVENNENNGLKYCFESSLWKDLDLYTILLIKNYRQNEENLITALSNMRTNSLTKQDIALLSTRVCEENSDMQNALHIFATNFEADSYNNKKFKKIDSKEYKLYAIDGVYQGEKLLETPTNIREENILKRIDVVCNAEKSISLKIGVRVMLLINLDFEKGLINGSCGEVKEINEDYVEVNFDNGQTSKITKHDFEFYNNEKLIAIRKQFPLRLAYGITIHKSQGMSLDKLVVDCSRIFEKGQAYVALSRIKTLDGLYLYNFNPARVMVDEKVVDFYKTLNIFDEDVKNIESTNNEPKITVTNVSTDTNSAEYYVNKIRNIILENNRWIEIFEIADILGVDRHKKLVEDDFNSTIAHLINRFLKKEGFLTKKIQYEQDYSIVVAPPDFDEDTIPEEILTIPYKNRK